MSFGLLILFLDILWLFAWFGIAVWFESDGSLPFSYRENIRDLLFHYANVGGMIYIIRHSTQKDLNWVLIIPFIFALLGDVQHLVSVIINLPQTHQSAWSAFLALSIWALSTTILGLFYFLSIKNIKKTNLR